MTVSIQQYRAAIGSFDHTKMPYKPKIKFSALKYRNVFRSCCFIQFILTISVTLSLTNLQFYQRQLYYSVDTAEVTSCSMLPEHVQVKYQYSSSNLGNKYAKYTYGNRKQAGIRIFHLNKGNSHLEIKFQRLRVLFQIIIRMYWGYLREIFIKIRNWKQYK